MTNALVAVCARKASKLICCMVMIICECYIINIRRDATDIATVSVGSLKINILVYGDTSSPSDFLVLDDNAIAIVVRFISCASTGFAIMG